jgi:hypothetical protein
MSAGEPVLGALSCSWRVFSRNWPENATRTASCIENKLRSPILAKHSLWHLAGVEACAFKNANSGHTPRRFSSRAAMLFPLALYERRTHPSGQALCLLRFRRGRFMASAAGLSLLVSGAGALSPYAGTTLAVVVIVLLAPGCVRAVRARTARRQLGRLNPCGRHVYVHSVASALPGAGAELLRELTREADGEGWSLLLDARNGKLARYYANFGFVAQGPAVKMPTGESHVRMWRPADPLEGERNARQ